MAISIVGLSAFLGLASCGGQSQLTLRENSISNLKDRVLPDTSPPRIAALDPPPGEVSSMPKVITVTFSKEVTVDVAKLDQWKFLCTSGSGGISGVYINGLQVMIEVSSITLFGATQDCTLQASDTIMDLSGQKLEGTRDFVYSISGSGGGGTDIDKSKPVGTIQSPLMDDRVFGKSVPVFVDVKDADQGIYDTYVSGVDRVEFFLGGQKVGIATSAPFTYFLDSTTNPNGLSRLTIDVIDKAGNRATSAAVTQFNIQNRDLEWSATAGGSGGTAFEDKAPDGFVLSGLIVRAGQYVDRVQPIFKPAWGEAAMSNIEVLGQGHGGGGGSQVILRCPSNSLYRVVGLYGYEDKFINYIGIKCERLDGSGYIYKSGGAGTKSGYAFDFSCAQGSFTTSLGGAAGKYVDQIKLGCQ